MIDQYAVMGDPISHSKSPLIHRCFAQQAQQAMEYHALQVSAKEFKTKIAKFFKDGGKGLNITVPLKELAWELVDQRSPLAERAGAVNTISLHQDKLLGANTDGIGLVRDIIQNHKGSLANKKILILGAGGAVRGVLEPVLLQQPESVTIVNRTVEKANNLHGLFADLGEVRACAYNELEHRPFDLIINGTSASLHGQLPPLNHAVIGQNTWCYDMMYSNDKTLFNGWAEAQGAEKILDGLGMLVEQAAEAFYIWRGIRPDTASVIEKIKQGNKP